MLKRGVDIALSFSLLIAGLPLLAIAAILIKLDSKGSIFFSQPRMGRGFTRFRIWKLRTMHACDPGCVYTLGADPRITRVGHWLRRLKVDEIPQLWNVLRGEMSLVGPRPVVPDLAIEFRRAYQRLLEVRPGLTDPASIKYCRETELLALINDQPRYFKSVLVPDKIRVSTAYLKHANFWSDLIVLGNTLWVVLAFNRRLAAGGDKESTEVRIPRMLFVEPVPGQTPGLVPGLVSGPASGFKKPPASEPAEMQSSSQLNQA